MVSRLFLLPWLVLLTVTNLLAAPARAELSVTLDRNPVRVNESFVLDIKTDAVDADEPVVDWPDGISQLRRNTISSRSIVNGTISAERTWRYSLIARRPGDYLIPAITVGKDSSAALTITVLAADSRADATATDQPVLLRANVDRHAAYVGQQLLLTVQVLRKVPMRFAQLAEPNLPTVTVQRLGDDSEYETIVNGSQYMVVERRYALFPQQAGDLLIPPIAFQADISQERQLSMFGVFEETQPITLETESIELEIKPPVQTSGWLPAQHLEVADAVSSGPYRVGEPLTWTITLIADGVLPAQLPELAPMAQGNWKLYPDQPQDKSQLIAGGIRTTRSQKFALVPQHAGTLTLPTMDLSWWRTSDDSAQHVALAPLELTIEPAAVSTVAKPAEAKPETPVTTVPQAAPIIAAKVEAAATPDTYWPWLAGVFALLWLLTLLLWWWTRQRGTRRDVEVKLPAGDQHAGSKAATWQMLRDACARDDAKAAHDTMLALTGQRQLADIAAAQDADVAAAIHALQRALYGPPPRNWQGRRLTGLLDRLRSGPAPDRPSPTASALPPLYPPPQR